MTKDDSPSNDDKADGLTIESNTCASPRQSAFGTAISEALGRRLVNPVVSMVDVDGVIRRVDLNDAVNRINWNNVVDSIDWNNLLSKLDMDALLSSVDIDAVMERIDIDAIVDRSNLKDIMAKSTSGVMSHLTDSLRAQIIMVDQIVQRVGRCEDCRLRCKGDAPKLYEPKWVLPPKPNQMVPLRHRKKRKENLAFRKSIPCPDQPSHLAIAVQGRAAGIVSRFAAHCIDWTIIVCTYSLSFVIVNETIQDIQLSRGESDALWDLTGPVGFFVWLGYNFCYFFVSLATASRTFGKYILGLVVVQSYSNAHRLSFPQVFFRSLCMATPFFLVVAAFVQWVREDRRSLIDLLVGTTVVYTWDARQFAFVEEAVDKDVDEEENSDIEEILQELKVQRAVRQERRLIRQETRKKLTRQETVRRRNLMGNVDNSERNTPYFECDEQNPV